MSDQQRWFKLWHSALSDDQINALPPALRWAWAAFGAHTKVHGESGKVCVSPNNAVLAAEMGVPLSQLKSTIETLPHMVVEESKNSYGEFTVTWVKWRHFQEDSTAADRMRALRSKRRREENRSGSSKTQKIPPPIAPPNSFDKFWAAWPWKHHLAAALKAYRKLRPDPELLTKIIAAVEDQKVWPFRGLRDEAYSRHAGTWLNARGWEDPKPITAAGLPEKAKADTWIPPEDRTR